VRRSGARSAPEGEAVLHPAPAARGPGPPRPARDRKCLPVSPRPELRCFPPDEAAAWRRIRRYAVPRWMIERATERRLAGDWQGACAAANGDVLFDLAEVADHCGHDVA